MSKFYTPEELGNLNVNSPAPPGYVKVTKSGKTFYLTEEDFQTENPNPPKSEALKLSDFLKNELQKLPEALRLKHRQDIVSAAVALQFGFTQDAFKIIQNIPSETPQGEEIRVKILERIVRELDS